VKAVDLFAGAGGFSLGLTRAGFKVVLANEYSVDPEWTYRHNLLAGTVEALFPEDIGETSIRAKTSYRAKIREQILDERGRIDKDFTRHMRGGDIKNALPNRWLDAWQAQGNEDLDLVVAGPPCQGFSSAGKRDVEDERNLLVSEALRVVRRLRPRVVIIENVPGMLHRHSEIVRKIGEELTLMAGGKPGYFVTAELLHSSLLGVPQTRKRLLVVGVRQDIIDHVAHARLHNMVFPTGCPDARPDKLSYHGKSVSPGETYTASDVLGDLAPNPPLYGTLGIRELRYRQGIRLNSLTRELRASRRVYLSGGVAITGDPSTHTLGYFNHEASAHVQAVSERMRLLREAACANDDARLNRCSSGWLRDSLAHQYCGVVFTKKASQRVLLADEWPMLTVTSLPDDIVHFEEDRIPTVREVARLQTFPDWFELKGVRTTGAERRRAGIYVPQYTQVANAVPPRLAHAVAARIRQFLIHIEEDPACGSGLEGGDYTSPNTGKGRDQLDELNRHFQEIAGTLNRRGSSARGATLGGAV
jgi:DNA (cytosine-5)-methyltransferase 1